MHMETIHAELAESKKEEFIEINQDEIPEESESSVAKAEII